MIYYFISGIGIIFEFVPSFVSLVTLEDMSDLFDGVYSVTREVIGETCTSYFSN